MIEILNFFEKMDEQTKSYLDILIVTLESFIEKLKEKNQIENDQERESHYDEIEFAKQIGALADTISHECTKFSLVFTDGAVPSMKASETLSNRLIGMSAALFKTVVCLSIEETGHHLRRSIGDAAIDVFTSMASLVVAAKGGSANTKAQLKETGTIWEACDRLKSVPKNSRDLLLRTMGETTNMVNDAFSEIQELCQEANESQDQNDDNHHHSFSEADKVRLNACSQLVKAAKAIITKIRTVIEESKADSKATIKADDEVTRLVSDLSPRVDDVVAPFHEDELDLETLDKEVSKLDDSLQGLLNTFRSSPYFQEESHGKWIEILRTGVQHNVTKYRYKI